MTTPLPLSFYDRDVVDVARALLGQVLRRGSIALRITEVEAYAWPGDTACHARAGRTPRTEALFGPPGRAYVYLCYGLHHMLNVVTGGEHEAAAVLIRACEPIAGLSLVRRRRGGQQGPGLLAGPGKVGEALALDTSWTHHPLHEPGGLTLEPGTPPSRVLAGTRIGIEFAAPRDRARRWRFAAADSRAVTHRAHLRPSVRPGARASGRDELC